MPVSRRNLSNRKLVTKSNKVKEHFEVVRDRELEFTYKLAARVIEMPDFKGERPLRDRHVDYLVDKMKEGKFLFKEAGIAIARCMWDSTDRRVNGHHTCWARSSMPDGWKPKIRVTEYKCHSPEEFRELYSMFDRNAPRTQGHVANIRLLGTPEFEGVSQSCLSMLRQGLRFWLYGNNPVAQTADEVPELMLGQYNKLCHHVLKMVQLIASNNAYRKIAKRASVIAAMFETYSKVVADSDAFWERVVTGVGIDSTVAPEKKLTEYLQVITLGGATSSSNVGRPATNESVYRMCVHCFNLFRKGEQRRILKSPNIDGPRPRAK